MVTPSASSCQLRIESKSLGSVSIVRWTRRGSITPIQVREVLVSSFDEAFVEAVVPVVGALNTSVGIVGRVVSVTFFRGCTLLGGRTGRNRRLSCRRWRPELETGCVWSSIFGSSVQVMLLNV